MLYYPGIIDTSRLYHNSPLHKLYGTQAHSKWQIRIVEKSEDAGFGGRERVPLLARRTIGTPIKKLELNCGYNTITHKTRKSRGYDAARH